MEHFAYWRGHSLPVIVILHEDETGKCYWQVVNEKTAIITGKGWKIEVPKDQVLGEEAKPPLTRIADTGWLESARTFTTPEKFFRRVETNPLFDYEQKLQGRKNSLAEMHAFLANSDESVAVLDWDNVWRAALYWRSPNARTLFQLPAAAEQCACCH